RRLDRHPHIARVVERVIRRVIADAIGEDALGRKPDHIVREELEGEQALAARHHDERRLPDPAAENAHALPRVLAQVTHAHVEHRAADEIDGLEAGAIEARCDIGHHRRRHARRPQALMRVAQRDIDELDRALAAHQWASRATGCAWKGTVVAMAPTRKRASADLAAWTADGRSGPLTMRMWCLLGDRQRLITPGGSKLRSASSRNSIELRPFAKVEREEGGSSAATRNCSRT